MQFNEDCGHHPERVRAKAGVGYSVQCQSQNGNGTNPFPGSTMAALSVVELFCNTPLELLLAGG